MTTPPTKKGALDPRADHRTDREEGAPLHRREVVQAEREPNEDCDRTLGEAVRGSHHDRHPGTHSTPLRRLTAMPIVRLHPGVLSALERVLPVTDAVRRHSYALLCASRTRIDRDRCPMGLRHAGIDLVPVSVEYDRRRTPRCLHRLDAFECGGLFPQLLSLLTPLSWCKAHGSRW